MQFVKGFLIFLFVAHFAFSDAILDPDFFPGDMVIQLNDPQLKESILDLRCDSWRVAEEANNLLPWKRIPEECFDYVKKYVNGIGYILDLQMVSKQAVLYARSFNMSGDGKSAWIFDVDETLISNLPYYAEHGYGLELFDNAKFDEWTEMGVAPVIEPSLKLYEEVLKLGFKVILLTGRSERHRNITIQNLSQVGFGQWDKLIMRSVQDMSKSATVFKSEKRKNLIEEDGYEIAGNSGDQWSDLLDSYMAKRSFKLPNPMYFIS